LRPGDVVEGHLEQRAEIGLSWSGLIGLRHETIIAIPCIAVSSQTATLREVATASAPVAAAIGIFGVVYGAAAKPILGPLATVFASVLMFSGAAQFTIVALVGAGASTVAVLGAVTMLALRHLPLGAVVRTRISGPLWRRLALASFLTDETVGLALTLGAPPHQTMLVSGVLAYSSWVIGTLIGVGGVSLAGIEDLAGALFPVLFVGLTALTTRTRGDVARSLIAALGAVALIALWPQAGALGAVAVAMLVAMGFRR
jgi:predicted branched-subunit amino acid permease